MFSNVGDANAGNVPGLNLFQNRPQSHAKRNEYDDLHRFGGAFT